MAAKSLLVLLSVIALVAVTSAKQVPLLAGKFNVIFLYFVLITHFHNHHANVN